MANTTIAGAATGLFNALAADSYGNPESALVSAGVKKVYAGEPGATGAVKPCSITIQFTRWTPTDWVFTIRVYVADLPPVTAYDVLQDAITACDDLLSEGPSQGEIGWIEELECHVASSEVMVGREDF